MNLSRLPEPDEFGNHWYGKPGDGNSPAILPILSERGAWMLSMGSRGILFEGPKIRRFDTPREALRELKKVLK